MRFSTLAVAAAAAGSAFAQDPSDESVCNRYTAALLGENTAENQYTLLTLLVKTVVIGNFTGPGSVNPDLPGSMNTVPGILAEGEFDGEQVNLMPYFDGTLASTNRGGDSGVSVNFLDGAAEEGDLALTSPTSLGAEDSNTSRLLAHLIQFFGAALGCSEYGNDGFPAYQGETGQANVHRFMALSYAENTYFIQQVGLAATSFGATMEDVSGVALLLNTTFNQRCAPPTAVLPDAEDQYQVICQDPDCPLAATTESICTGDAAFGTFTAAEPSTATMTGGDDDMTMTEPSGTMETDTVTETETDTETETETQTETETETETEMTGSATDDDGGAPRQTAAAGVMAVAGIVAAAFL